MSRSKSFSKVITSTLPILVLGGLVVFSAIVPPTSQVPVAQAESVPTFGFQLSESPCGSLAGPQAITSADTGWVGDGNQFDPNCARVYIGSNISTWNVDFRVVIGVSDGPNHGSGCGDQFTGFINTPWASDGGGSSGWGSDNGVYDPNCVRMQIETRPMPQSKGVTDARLGVAVANGPGCRTSNPGMDKLSPWSSAGGG